ncbi:hypothetical protein F4802DRAFT_593696 [Xylaria palmicola]|nr:hypothetical protein F4802DRAFT_593696 [Xylaria palmicola]
MHIALGSLTGLVALALVSAVPLPDNSGIATNDISTTANNTSIAPNATSITSNDTSNASNDTVQVNKHHPYAGWGLIPVSEVGCWEDTLDPAEVDGAKTRLAFWAKRDKIKPGRAHGEGFGNVAVWICNCKHFVKDHSVVAENNEAQDLITEECGENRSGWVWSRKWQKSINFGTVSRFADNRWASDRCPKDCLWP